MPENGLFDQFDGVSSKLWKQQIQYELKGADYNETLIWESPEGIKVKPFYHADEALAPVTSGQNQTAFNICQDIFVHDLDKSIRRAADSIARGAESLRLKWDDPSVDIQKLLAEIPSNIAIHLRASFIDRDVLSRIDETAEKQALTVFCHIDPIGQLCIDGNWFPGDDNFEVLRHLNSTLKSVSVFGINASVYHNAGANVVQQIAYALAHANEYFNEVGPIQKPLSIEVAIGSNYFFEIAKLRALRKLYEIIAAEYKHDEPCHIFAVPGKRNKTLYDYNVNMLRTTTECMSAALGGADTISNMPYDALYHKSNEFGERISRNQLLILKHESYFDKTHNAADGSYYIESLTQQLAEKSLALFKEIEAEGGFLKQLKASTIQRKINDSAAREQHLFDSGKEVLLGTSKYPNQDDRMADNLELFPFVKVKPRKTLIVPIVEKRLAEKIEQQRLAVESPKS